MSEKPAGVDIRPGIGILGVLKHLNYKPWFALAEFVDNAVQSFEDLRDEIQRADDRKAELKVKIDFDPDRNRISIHDNAGGIALGDMDRAFRPAEVPPDTSGLHEFGMGMKSAACWFSDRWRVTTKALGEEVERVIEFDIKKIIKDDVGRLVPKEKSKPRKAHYTVVTLEDVTEFPQGKTIGKIREHLADIYRDFLRSNTLELVVGNEVVAYERPPELKAPEWGRDQLPTAGADRRWKKPIDFRLSSAKHVKGEVWLLAKGSTRRAGLCLMRKGRVIVGTGDDLYKPDAIYGGANSFRRQRLCGEVHLDGFEVTHTKDGIRWGGGEEEQLVKLLKHEIDAPPLRLLHQADNYRANLDPKRAKPIYDEVLKDLSDVVLQNVPPILPRLVAPAPNEADPPKSLTPLAALSRGGISLDFEDVRWHVTFELTDDASLEESWLEVSVSDPKIVGKRRRQDMTVRLSTRHKFMQNVVGAERPAVEAAVRLATAICIAEKAARDSGMKSASLIRTKVNLLLAEALWRSPIVEE